VFTNTPAVLQPEILVFRAHENFDDEGRLTDERTREFVGRLLEALASHARMHRAAGG
jgi:chromate reductase, NAD(P)H dehydrogenase (quinone)